jgi:hypothetical protein
MTTKIEAAVAMVSEFRTLADVAQYVEDMRAHGIPDTAFVEGYAVARFVGEPTAIPNADAPSVIVVLGQEEDGDEPVTVD